MDGDKSVYAAFIPTSPDRHVFKEFKEMHSFLNSSENKKLNKDARFKKCLNDSEVDEFFNETAKSLLDMSLNDSFASPSSLPVEPKALFSEPEPPRLNRFRVLVERKDNKSFDDAIEENPRFILNTTLDGPTILQGSQRHNVMHIACSAGNLYVVERTLKLLESEDFLCKAYGNIHDIDSLTNHLIDTFLNTPDKNANNSPLHFACKNGHFEIVRRLIGYGACRRTPMNRFEQTPIELLCQTFKGTAEEKKHASSEIKRLLYSISTPKASGYNRASVQTLIDKQASVQTVTDKQEDDDIFVDALEYIDGGGDKVRERSNSDKENVNHIKSSVLHDEEDEYFDARGPISDDIDELSDHLEKAFPKHRSFI